jgi:hypothetical protein
MHVESEADSKSELLCVDPDLKLRAILSLAQKYFKGFAEGDSGVI